MGDELVEEQIDVPGKKAKWQKFIDRSGQIMVLRERLPNTDEEKGVHEQYKRQWAKAANDAQRQNIARMGGMKQTIMTPHTLHALEVIQLMNLCPSTPEEIDAVIPSMRRIPHQLKWFYCTELETRLRKDVDAEGAIIGSMSNLSIHGGGPSLKRQKCDDSIMLEQMENGSGHLHPRIHVGRAAATRDQYKAILGKKGMDEKKAYYYMKVQKWAEENHSRSGGSSMLMGGASILALEGVNAGFSVTPGGMTAPMFQGATPVSIATGMGASAPGPGQTADLGLTPHGNQFNDPAASSLMEGFAPGGMSAKQIEDHIAAGRSIGHPANVGNMFDQVGDDDLQRYVGDKDAAVKVQPSEFTRFIDDRSVINAELEAQEKKEKEKWVEEMNQSIILDEHVKKRHKLGQELRGELEEAARKRLKNNFDTGAYFGFSRFFENEERFEWEKKRIEKQELWKLKAEYS